MRLRFLRRRRRGRIRARRDRGKFISDLSASARSNGLTPATSKNRLFFAMAINSSYIRTDGGTQLWAYQRSGGTSFTSHLPSPIREHWWELISQARATRRIKDKGERQSSDNASSREEPMQHSKTSSDVFDYSEPALDFNCGWSVVSLLSALSLNSQAAPLPKAAAQTDSKRQSKRGNARIAAPSFQHHEYS
jgi:hypothetical protein